jgi:hypothetical protein
LSEVQTSKILSTKKNNKSNLVFPAENFSFDIKNSFLLEHEAKVAT